MECSNPMQTHSIMLPRSKGSWLPPWLLLFRGAIVTSAFCVGLCSCNELIVTLKKRCRLEIVGDTPICDREKQQDLSHQVLQLCHLLTPSLVWRSDFMEGRLCLYVTFLFHFYLERICTRVQMYMYWSTPGQQLYGDIDYQHSNQPCFQKNR